MKLEKVLENLNSLEKNSFLKIIDTLISGKPKNQSEIEKILTETNRDLKSVDNNIISRVFNLLESEYLEYLRDEFINSTSQIDLLTDIVIRDGNCIMKQEWFAKLYENELTSFDKKLKDFRTLLEKDSVDIDPSRIRDYNVYKKCLHTAFYNDLLNNQDPKITQDEKSILITLSEELDLSQEEVKLINYLVLEIKKVSVDDLINELKTLGIVFYSKKFNTIYIPDELVRVLRKVRGKDVADKYLRRILISLRDSQINLICRKHNLDWKKNIEGKIKDIINAGISIQSILIQDIHKSEVKVSEKKALLNDFFEKSLKISGLKGVTIEDKIENLIKYFEELDKDDKVSISLDGYEKLLIDLGNELPLVNDLIRKEFELQEENALNSKYLLDYNIKPRDVLDIIPEKNLEKFCELKSIKTRGDVIFNILEQYKDAENLYLENFTNIGCRDLNKLKENGIVIKEPELGIKFEELAKLVFKKLGFNVDENLRKKISTNKDKIDIILNLDQNEVIIIECKTLKDSGYNKFSSVSRQLKSYIQITQGNGHKVVKSLLVAPDFSDDFVNECGLDYELNLSLIKTDTLIKILNAFKSSKKHKQFPYTLLMRDVLIQEDRIIKAIDK